MKFHIRRSDFGCGEPGTCKHVGRHIDPDRFAGRAYFACRQQHVQPTPAAQIQHHLAGLERRGGHRIAAREPHVGLGRKRGQLFLRVAESRCDLPDRGGIVGEATSSHRSILIVNGPQDLVVRLVHVRLPVRVLLNCDRCDSKEI